MRQDIINAIEIEIKKRCENEKISLVWVVTIIIKAVVKNAIILSENYGADEEIVKYFGFFVKFYERYL